MKSEVSHSRSRTGAEDSSQPVGDSKKEKFSERKKEINAMQVNQSFLTLFSYLTGSLNY